MKTRSKIRQLQEWSVERNWPDWRIPYILYPEDKGLRVTKIKNPMGWVSIFGIFLFLTSFAYFMIKKEKNEHIELTITAFVLGFSMAAIGSIFHEKIRKRNWPAIRAQCLDHELKLWNKPQRVCAMRALCKFELDEKEITCTPEISWPKLYGEKRKEKYLEKDSDGLFFCTLLVNPQNPHETYFLKLK